MVMQGGKPEAVLGLNVCAVLKEQLHHGYAALIWKVVRRSRARGVPWASLAPPLVCFLVLSFTRSCFIERSTAAANVSVLDGQNAGMGTAAGGPEPWKSLHPEYAGQDKRMPPLILKGKRF